MATSSPPSTPSPSLKNSGSLGEAEERKPAASEGHFIPLDTSDGFPQSLGCWCGVSVSAERAHIIAEHGRTDSHFNLKTEPLWSTALQCGTVKSGKSNKRRQGQNRLSGSAGTVWPPFGPLLILNPTVPYASAANSQHPSKASPMATAYWTSSLLLRLNSPKPYIPFLAEWRYHSPGHLGGV